MNVIMVTKVTILSYRYGINILILSVTLKCLYCNSHYNSHTLRQTKTFPCHLFTSNENIAIILIYLYSYNTIGKHCTVSSLKLLNFLISI